MNKENYKKALDQIYAKEELKNETFEKINKRENLKGVKFIKYFAVCAMVVVLFSMTALYTKDKNKNNSPQPEIKIAKIKNDLPRFQNIEELKKVLTDNNKSRDIYKKEFEVEDALNSLENSEGRKEDLAYSKTNTQVENVDEADIVKTDGNYIYYVAGTKIYIIEANDLKTISEIEIKDNNTMFYPSEIYVYKNKLVILGNSNEYEESTRREYIDGAINDVARISSGHMTNAIVYDIENKQEPKQVRQVSLDGNYIDSRLIGENLYFISSKSARYYTEMKDEEILPITKDTSRVEETKRIEVTDIAYFKGTQSYEYMIVAGFNINNDNEANIETFFGASENVYANEKNLYITQSVYQDGLILKGTKNTIYKFNLSESQISLQCKGEVEGYLNNQFSMDEYNGNLRIATTSGYNKQSTNQLYILDENLHQIGEIKDLAKGEKIYSVRFMGKVGYIVTFEQVDPLFVIDLSNPTNPVVKGQLKIPGYSSYLHPYDETHIIGIGYNTKSNGHGGVTNTNMKMSMFDVSDLEHPREMFNINIGGNYAYSEVLYNHKALFYSKEKNLIGFPATYREYLASKDRNAFVMYKIDLEKGFEKYGEITQKIDYRTNIDRAIYIGDRFYTLSATKIVMYDLKNINKINELELKLE